MSATVNGRSIGARRSAPVIAPKLSAGVPTLATGNLDLTFSDGEPGGPGIYLFGGPPTGVGLGITPWFSLDLPVAPLVTLPFIAACLTLGLLFIAFQHARLLREPGQAAG